TFSKAKSKLIAAGLYRPARFLADHVLYPARSRDRRKRQNFYRQLIAPGDLCFDVGANIGDYTETLVSLGARLSSRSPRASTSCALALPATITSPSCRWHWARRRARRRCFSGNGPGWRACIQTGKVAATLVPSRSRSRRSTD